MKYVFQDKVFNTHEEAETYAAPIINQYLVDEAHRFSVVKEVVNGGDVVWTPADLTTDSEELTYLVFNTVTGRHEKVDSKTAAVAKLEEVKLGFLSFYGYEIKEITDVEALSYTDLFSKAQPRVLQ